MRVLVLGADGFLGRRVVATLAASDWATPIAAGRRAREGSGERVVLDATDAAQVRAAVGGVDAVVNCISGDAATIVANAAALFGAGSGARVIHMSSMAVYGDATGVVGEDAPLRGEGGYAGAKVEAERLARAAGGVTLLRPGCIYGAGSPQWTQRIAQLLAARRIGDLGAGGDGGSNLVHVDDVVAAILVLLQTPREDGIALNLAMPDAPDWNGYFVAFAKAIGAVPVARIPDWRLKAETLAAIPLKLMERARIGAPPAIPPSLARLWRQDIRLDTTRAQATLPIAWTSLEDGLREAAASVRDAARTA